MQQGYCIRSLDVSAIMYDNEEERKFKQNGRRIPLKIKGETFSDIPFKLPIRGKAYDFAKRNDGYYDPMVYVVLYADEEHLQCLFVFRFIASSGACDIARCVGKNSVRRHWGRVRQYIQRYGNAIRDGVIAKNSHLEFD